MDMLRGGFMPGLLGNGQGTVGAGSSYDAATEAIAAAFTTPPTTARKNLIDAAVVALKAAGVWTKLDALYAFAAADNQAAKINWVAPGTFNCTEVNAPAFTVDRGFTGASTVYLDSGFNPTTAPSPKFVQNSACAFGWAVADVTVSGGIVGDGSNNTVATTVLYPHHTSVGYVYRVNSTTNAVGGTPNAQGLHNVNRSASNLTTLYRNGASVLTDATASVASVNATQKFLAGVQTEWWIGGQAAAGGFGSNLNSTEQAALYNALRTYMTGVGVP